MLPKLAQIVDICQLRPKSAIDLRRSGQRRGVAPHSPEAECLVSWGRFGHPRSDFDDAVLGMRASSPGPDGLSHAAWKQSPAFCRGTLYAYQRQVAGWLQQRLPCHGPECPGAGAGDTRPLPLAATDPPR